MFKQLAQRHCGGTLMVVKKGSDDNVTFLGSGFLCHSKGYILTCAHLINLTDKLSVIPPQPLNEFNKQTLSRVNPIDVTIAQYDPVNDVALLKIDNSIAVSLPDNVIGTDNLVQIGSSVAYLGFPYGQSGLHTLKLSQSIVSSKVISENGTKQFQLDSMVHEGNSGGPLVDFSSGKVIGIVSGRFSPTGNGASIQIGNHSLGTESTISYATAISYGLAIMKDEGINV
ncbi:MULTISPECIES: S1C family serine protease [Vibrionaceae]|uniref:S1C family serine protease n=1 Tax=Vibrionaceae TaxID=641 RepID=UPI001B30576F|nr:MULTISPECIES: serine protease [Vibrionaceae]MCD9469417.1 hypothetical protein [Photobacterium phosphoreum]